MTREISELTGFNQLVQARTAVYLANKHDAYVGASLLKYGEFSETEVELFDAIVNPGDIVIEIGANIGAHTVRLAQMVGDRGRVLAFEPQRIVFQTLCANVALNSMTNVECYQQAVSNARTSINIPDVDPRQDNNFGGLDLEEAERVLGGNPVQCTRLDDLLGYVKHLRLLKIDVEGMEADVIESGRQLIETLKPVLYVENDRPEKSEHLMKLLNGLGYRLYWHCPYLYRRNNFNGDAENIFGEAASFNMLCVHREAGQATGLPEIDDFTKHPMVVDEKVAA